MCLQLELSHVRFMKLSLHFSAAVDKQGFKAAGRGDCSTRARQGGHLVHGGLMSDMHFSGMPISDIFDEFWDKFIQSISQNLKTKRRGKLPAQSDTRDRRSAACATSWRGCVRTQPWGRAVPAGPPSGWR
jgi:hypothetical protein